MMLMNYIQYILVIIARIEYAIQIHFYYLKKAKEMKRKTSTKCKENGKSVRIKRKNDDFQ